MSESDFSFKDLGRQVERTAIEYALQTCRLLLVLLPGAAVLAAVSRQSKVVAAFAQLADLQERSDRQQALASKAVEVDKLLGFFFCQRM